MILKIGKYKLLNDIDVKCIMDGWEISSSAVKKYDIKPADFDNAYWSGENIIVEL